ncbi:hypothetical protein TNCV_982741 [Trichonephila clavipes]|nr:hypothetical protein TNCV_982741 [Trichonephila clavipes]
MITLAHMDDNQSTASGCNPNLNITTESYMDLSLPASNHSRPMTPQDSTSPTKKGTYCRKLQFLASNINLMAEEMETSKKLIQAILDKGHTEDPFLVETMKHLEISVNSTNKR